MLCAHTSAVNTTIIQEYFHDSYIKCTLALQWTENLTYKDFTLLGLRRNVKIRLRQQAGFLSPYAFWSIASENGDGNIKTGD